MRPLPLALALALALSAVAGSAAGFSATTSVDAAATSVFDGVVYGAHDDSFAGAPVALSHDVTQTAYGRTSAVVKVRASAASDPGQLRVLASSEFPGVVYCTGSPFCNGIGTVRGSAQAYATQYADDIVFSGTGPITTSVSLDLSGAVARVYDWIDGTTNATYTGGSIPDATVHVDYSLTQMQAGDCEGTPCMRPVGLASGFLDLASRYDGKTTITSAGFKNAPSVWSNGKYTLESTDFTAVSGDPVAMFLDISIDTAEQYSHSGGDHILSSLAFAHSFGLTTAGPVFALTAGQNVSSAALLLADNLFTPVPEPATALSVGLGLAGLAGLARARRDGRGRSSLPA